MKTATYQLTKSIKGMKLFLIMISFMVVSHTVFSQDDSQRYKAAKFYKSKIIKAVGKSPQKLKGECRLMLSMNHIDNKYAELKRIRTSGNSQVCKVAAKELKIYKNKKISYDVPEKLLRITVDTDD